MASLKQNLTRRLYALVPVPLESEALLRHRKRAGWGGFANSLACCALIFLILASAVPAFLVTRVKGGGDLLAVHYEVDVVVGDGLWSRGQCFGQSAEGLKEILGKVGISCDGVPQTQNCWRDDLTTAEQDDCSRFWMAQGLEIVAIASLIVTVIAGTSNREGLLPVLVRAVALTNALVAAMASSAVLSLLQDSYMFTKTTDSGERIVDEASLQYQCTVLFGLSVCHGPGFSFQLQALASCLASLSSVVSLCLFLTTRVLGDTPSSMLDGRNGATLVVVEERETPLLDSERGYGELPTARVVSVRSS